MRGATLSHCRRGNPQLDLSQDKNSLDICCPTVPHPYSTLPLRHLCPLQPDSKSRSGFQKDLPLIDLCLRLFPTPQVLATKDTVSSVTELALTQVLATLPEGTDSLRRVLACSLGEKPGHFLCCWELLYFIIS